MALPLDTNYGPSPAWTVQAGTGGNQSLVSSTGVASFIDLPQNGFLAQNVALEDLGAATPGVVATAGTAYATRFRVYDDISTTSGVVFCGTVATTPAHGWLYLLDTSGNLIAKTADKTSTYLNATGATVYAWAGGPVAVAPGVYYGVALSNGGTGGYLVGVTTPSVNLDYNQSAVAGSSGYKFAKFGTGIGTSGLSTPFTMTGMTEDGLVQPFFGLL